MSDSRKCVCLRGLRVEVGVEGAGGNGSEEPLDLGCGSVLHSG